MFGMMLGMMERWMPLAARRHLIAARRERLLAVRAWLDGCIAGLETKGTPEAPPEAGRPGETSTEPV